MRTFEIGSTEILYKGLPFASGCYSFPPPALPVCLKLVGVPGPVGLVWGLGQEELWEKGFTSSWPAKNIDRSLY